MTDQLKSDDFSSLNRTMAGLLQDMRKTADPESRLKAVFGAAPDAPTADETDFVGTVNGALYRFILKHYRDGESRVCLWRFVKKLPFHRETPPPGVELMDALYRMYLYSDPLDDLTCIYIPISDPSQVGDYLEWIKGYFYDADYPTSLLWLYALDSAMASLFPDEVFYLGQRKEGDVSDIMIPELSYPDAVMIKRYSDRAGHFSVLEGPAANNEFRLLFRFLKHEYRDRCLSRSMKRSETEDAGHLAREWEKFKNVLLFGVSDRHETGCVSFSDMRASTEFLNTFGKDTYLNKIQQPFFARTKLISKQYFGRIDKFMGDNVMCVFLTPGNARCGRRGRSTAVLNHFFAIYELCRILYDLIRREGFEQSRLGLRSGVTLGEQILRSNLGNEFVRDFTVTGETVNLAARLEHISIHELRLHNEMYFGDAIERFPKISRLIAVSGDNQALNAETRSVVEKYTLYQNIDSNLQKLDKARFDIRFNQPFYYEIRAHLESRGYLVLNAATSELHGYEEYEVDGHSMKFYFMNYNPKGFANFERIWMLPLEPELLRALNIELLR